MSIEKDILTALETLLVYVSGPDGQPRQLASDGYGRLRVATGPPALFYKDLGVLTHRLVRGNPCYVTRFVVTNANAAVRYFNIHDIDVIPVATNIPSGQGMSFPVPAGTANNPGVLSVELGETHQLVNGLAWSLSTAVNVFTNSATASEHSVHMWYTLLTPKDN